MRDPASTFEDPREEALWYAIAGLIAGGYIRVEDFISSSITPQALQDCTRLVPLNRDCPFISFAGRAATSAPVTDLLGRRSVPGRGVPGVASES